jgi:hypothetical protein
MCPQHLEWLIVCPENRSWHIVQPHRHASETPFTIVILIARETQKKLLKIVQLIA